MAKRYWSARARNAASMGQILAMRRTVTAMDDKTISLKDAMDTINQICNDDCYHIGHEGRCYKDCGLNKVRKALEELPSAQPDLTKEYAKAVRTWLVHYQVKCAELQGSYTPYEVLGWIVSDWRKENEIW